MHVFENIYLPAAQTGNTGEFLFYPSRSILWYIGIIPLTHIQPDSNCLKFWSIRENKLKVVYLYVTQCNKMYSQYMNLISWEYLSCKIYYMVFHWNLYIELEFPNFFIWGFCLAVIQSVWHRSQIL
jgi:hypothetical protein